MTKFDLMRMIRIGCETCLDRMVGYKMPHDMVIGLLMGHMDVWRDMAAYIVPLGFEMDNFISDVYTELCDILICSKCRLK